MYRQCRHCGFKNPIDVGDCLYCRRSLLTTIGDAKKAFRTIGNIAKGQWAEAGKQIGGNLVTDQVSSLKYRFNPGWFIKLKLHGLKKAVIGIFWFFLIIIILVVMGLIYKALGGKL